jgi:hypothetical protein
VAIIVSGTSLGNNGLSAAASTIGMQVPFSAHIGDVALASFDCSGALTVTAVPGGWTLVAGPIANGGLFSGWLYYLIVGAGDIGSNFTWTFSGSQRPTGVLQTLSGVDTTNFLANIADLTNGNGPTATALIAPAVTTRVDQSWVLNFWMIRLASGTVGSTIAVPGTHTSLGFSNTAFSVSGIQTSIRAGRLTTPGVAGSYGTYTATAGSTGNYISFSIPLAPLPPTLPRPVMLSTASARASLR